MSPPLLDVDRLATRAGWIDAAVDEWGGWCTALGLPALKRARAVRALRSDLVESKAVTEMLDLVAPDLLPARFALMRGLVRALAWHLHGRELEQAAREDTEGMPGLRRLRAAQRQRVRRLLDTLRSPSWQTVFADLESAEDQLARRDGRANPVADFLALLKRESAPPAAAPRATPDPLVDFAELVVRTLPEWSRYKCTKLTAEVAGDVLHVEDRPGEPPLFDRLDAALEQRSRRSRRRD